MLNFAQAQNDKTKPKPRRKRGLPNVYAKEYGKKVVHKSPDYRSEPKKGRKPNKIIKNNNSAPEPQDTIAIQVPTTAEFPRPVDLDHNSFPVVAPPEPVEVDMSDEGGSTVKKKRSWGWDYLQRVDSENHKCSVYNCKKIFKGLDQRKITISNVTSHIKTNHREIYQLFNSEKISPIKDENASLCEWLARRNHSFVIVEEEEFKTLLSFKPASRNTLVNVYLPKIRKKYHDIVIFYFFMPNCY